MSHRAVYEREIARLPENSFFLHVCEITFLSGKQTALNVSDGVLTSASSYCREGVPDRHPRPVRRHPLETSGTAQPSQERHRRGFHWCNRGSGSPESWLRGRDPYRLPDVPPRVTGPDGGRAVPAGVPNVSGESEGAEDAPAAGPLGVSLEGFR